jgi:hypothetical protein
MLTLIRNVSAVGLVRDNAVMMPLGSLRALMQQVDSSEDDASSLVMGHLDISFSPVPDTTSAPEVAAMAVEAPTKTPDEICSGFCDGISTCDKSAQGSYCKLANSPNVCFALNWKTSEDGSKVMCYAGDADCPPTEPVLCNELPAEAPVI